MIWFVFIYWFWTILSSELLKNYFKRNGWLYFIYLYLFIMPYNDRWYGRRHCKIQVKRYKICFNFYRHKGSKIYDFLKADTILKEFTWLSKKSIVVYIKENKVWNAFYFRPEQRRWIHKADKMSIIWVRQNNKIFTLGAKSSNYSYNYIYVTIQITHKTFSRLIFSYSDWNLYVRLHTTVTQVFPGKDFWVPSSG